MTAKRGTSGGSFAGLVFGGLVGAGVALMAAPRSGKETRQQIGGFAEGLKGKATCYALLAKEKATVAAGKTRDYIKGKKSLITRAIEAGREAYERETWKRSHSCEDHEKGAGAF